MKLTLPDSKPKTETQLDRFSVETLQKLFFYHANEMLQWSQFASNFEWSEDLESHQEFLSRCLAIMHQVLHSRIPLYYLQTYRSFNATQAELGYRKFCVGFLALFVL